MKHSLKYFVLAFVFCLSGCSGVFDRDSRYTPVHKGYLIGNGVKIEAVDKSFVITEGAFIPPFQTVMSDWSIPLFKHKDINIADWSNYALKHGAKKVTIYHPSANKPLYGVLLLNPAVKHAAGPGGRSYYIKIPDSYVNAANSGRISVVYETVQSSAPEWYQRSGTEYYTWVLWLSGRPF